MGWAGFQCLQICLVDLLENNWFPGDKDEQTFRIQLRWSAAKCRDFHVSLCSFVELRNHVLSHWKILHYIQNFGARRKHMDSRDVIDIKRKCNLVVGHITNDNYYKWAQSNDYLSFRIHRLSCLWWWVGWSWRPGKQEFWLYRKKSSNIFNKIFNIKQFIKIYAHKFHENLCMSKSFPILSSHALLVLAGVNKKPFAW